MSTQSRSETNGTLQQRSVAAVSTGILQRKCDCGNHTIAGGTCDQCQNKTGVLQRTSPNNSEQLEVPPIVHEVLRSSGRPLDKQTRGFFESRFEHNFSSVPVSSGSPQVSRSSLTIGEPADVYEQEADRIANSIMLKDKHENKSLGANRRQNEKFDLSSVRIHTDAQAAASAHAINAQAYTFGHNIVFGAGQFAPATHGGRHLLAHELVHVAQQTGAAAINGGQLPISHLAQRKVIQRNQKVPTNFGAFETTKFDENPGKGVEVILKFHPDTAKVDATKIALTQSIKAMDKAGKAVASDPTGAGRLVPSGKSGEGYRIDRISSSNNPLYGGRNLTATEDLKDTPISPSTAKPGDPFSKTNQYQIGQPKDADKDKRDAVLYDRPEGGKHNLFETTALAIEGKDKDTYYGSVQWGFKIEGTDAAPTVKKIDITEVSKGTPSANFTEAAKLWNPAKTRGTLEVIADPEATVENVKTGEKIKLKKGTKLVQVAPVLMDDGSNGVETRIFKNGKASPDTYYVSNADLKDSGDGSDTTDLPIPVTKPPDKTAKPRQEK
jgi:hypothetical protein